MRSVIMWNAMTLDGHFEGLHPWDLTFHRSIMDAELERFSIDQLRQADCLLLGRVTYEGMAAYWTKATGAVADLMGRIQKVVFSKTLPRSDWQNTRIVRDPAEEEVARLRHEDGADILVFGSARLSASLGERGLIDEYRIGLAPVVLGDGGPLFKPGQTLHLRLLEARPFTSGCVVLRYQRR